MKILHLSTSDLDGGAARAAYRLHQGLQDIDVNSQMLVRAKNSLDSTVIAKQDLLTKLGPAANSLPLKFYPERDRALFSSQWFFDSVFDNAKKISSEIIHLHWICNGFLKIENIAKFEQPLVWTLHDMWTFTGGCHTTKGCLQYQKYCGNCPQLNSKKNWDLSSWTWKRKARHWKNLNLTFVSPSQWLAECASSSSLLANFKVKVIPHGLKLDKYKPIEKNTARRILNLPANKQLIGFGSGSIKDPNKGFALLSDALSTLRLEKHFQNIELVIFGSSQPQQKLNLKVKIHCLERFHDDISLSLIYSAVDVMVVPSLQESFGQTASESLSCSTPVVSFDATGLKDIIDHQQNGYLATPYEVKDLAKGIAWVLKDKDRYRKLQIEARKKAEREFSIELQARRYLSLYQEILGKPIENLSTSIQSIEPQYK